MKKIEKKQTKSKEGIKIKVADMLPNELKAEIQRLRVEIEKVLVERSLGKEKNVRRVFFARKQLARVLTVLNKKAIISK